VAVFGVVGGIASCPHQVNREKVLSRGKEVVGKLLVDLQVRKSTADGPGARKFYTQLTTPLSGWDKDIRDVVLKKKTVGGSKPILSYFETRYYVRVAPKAFCPTKHFHTRWRGSSEEL
jgi:hypothetical protein